MLEQEIDDFKMLFKSKLGSKEMSFVLIELLMALSIFVVIVSIVYTTLYMGIKSYKKAQREIKFNQGLNLVLDRLSSELRNCYNAEYNKEEDKGGFIGDSTNLSFFTIQNVFLQSSSKKVLARITYNFKEGKLFKKIQIDKNAFLDSGEFKEEELITDIEELNFKYLYFKEREDRYVWRSSWSDKSIIPQGIVVEIKLDGPEDNNQDFKIYIFLIQGQVIWG